MTLDDSEPVPDDVLYALKADGEHTAPAGARTRVLTRLGVAAAVGAATAAHAAAASAGAAKTAGASIPAGGAVGLALTKSLVLNPVLAVIATLGVGSSVGIVTYQAFEARHAPVTAPAQASASHAGKAPLNARAGANEPNPSEPVAPAPVAPAPRLAPARSPAPAVPLVPAARSVPPRPPTAELAPATALPASSGTARLAEQQRLLDQARASLRRGDGAGALAILSGHESLYPVTEFAEERGAIRILSLVMAGQSDEARRQAKRFEQRFPASLFLPSIRNAFGNDAGRPNVPAAHD